MTVTATGNLTPSTTAATPGAGRVEAPGSTAEAAALLRDTAGSVLVRGGGTKLAWGGRPAAPDVVIETRGMQRLVTHTPADMTAAVEAGMPLAALQAQLRTAGQWLALDPPREAVGATVGGLLATGESGPRRLRYGAMRDLVIGVKLVLPDGTVARAGGHVIKNVAGYDLSKLVYGSLGTLALIAEVVVRLHPLPEASSTLVADLDAPSATAVTLRLLASPLEPAAVDWLAGEGERGRLAVRFEGSAAGVRPQVSAAAGLLAEHGGATAQLADDDEAALWQEAGRAHLAQDGETLASVGTLPGNTVEVARALRQATREAGVTATMATHVALGLSDVRFRGATPAVAAAFDAWRARMLDLGATVALRDRPVELDDAVDPLGPPPSALPLLRSLASQLDPERRLAPGRFGAWY